MTVKVNDGGPAFPVPVAVDHMDVLNYGEGGMTLRDYFAAAALSAAMTEYFRGNGTCIGTEHAPRNCAAHAYRFADAMLQERQS